MVLTDLRNGDEVQIKQGGTYTVVNDLLRRKDGKSLSLSCYTEDMKSSCGYNMLDIVKVLRSGKVLFER